jgi:hypothetical protein
MGAFFTNVQVHIGDLTAKVARTQVVDSIRKYAASLGFTEVSDQGRAARTILVGPTTSYPWIAVYDEATEGQDKRPLESLAQMLCTTAGEAAIAILVHDSDLLELGIFRPGVKTIWISNWPGYFEGRPPNSRETASSRGLGELNNFISDRALAADLDAAWTQSEISENAIHVLKNISPLLDWDPELSGLGLLSVPKAKLATFVKLCFERVPGENRAMAPPGLGHAGGHGPDSRVGVGDSLPLLMIGHSTGGASQGLIITIWGPALDRRLIECDEATIRLGPPDTGALRVFRLETAQESSRILYVANLADFPIPRGVSDPASAFQNSGDVETGLAAWLSTRIELTVPARALKVGAADIHIGIAPTSNTEAGQISATIHLEVHGHHD